jgi:hypothetical protein
MFMVQLDMRLITEHALDFHQNTLNRKFERLTASADLSTYRTCL